MNFINKINKYLLEQYPLIWNTRLVWMLGINLIIHLLFFCIGYMTIHNMEDLKQYYSISAYFFETSILYYNFLISIAILLVWIIFYLRNNAFKNLYNISKYMLFQQFCIIVFIIFISITQYFSFEKGFSLKTKSLYNWEEVDKDIKVFNKTAMFLPQTQKDYEIEEKQYPEPFPLKIAVSYSEFNLSNIDTTKSYIKYNNRYLQFYKLKEDKKDDVTLYNLETNNRSFKRRSVKDVSQYKELIHPSLYNYSKVKFSMGQNSLDFKNQISYYQKILDEKDDYKIQEALKTFLQLAKKYDAEHNLQVNSWFGLINNKPNYLLTTLIGDTNPKDIDVSQLRYNYKKSDNINGEINIPLSKEFYFSYNKTINFFNNVHDAYFYKHEATVFYILFIICIAFGLLLFIFKTTNLKTILFGFVGGIVVLILIVWLMSAYNYVFEGYTSRENFVMCLILFLLILFAITSFLLRWKKIVTTVFWSLCLYAVPLFFLFLSRYYSDYLRKLHLAKFPKDYSFRSNFDIWFGNNGFWVIILIWLITVYIYSQMIRKLKAQLV